MNDIRVTHFLLPGYCQSAWFIHLVVCLTIGPKPLPNRAVNIMRSRASSFKWEYSLLSSRPSSSFPRLLPCLPVTSIPFYLSFNNPLKKAVYTQNMTIQLAFRLLIACRIILCSLTRSNTSSFLTWSVQLIFSILYIIHLKPSSSYTATNGNI